MIRSWDFQKKMTAGLLVMVALAVVTASIAVFTLRDVVASKDKVISVNAQLMFDAARLVSAVDQQTAGFRGYVASPENRFLQERNQAVQDFDALLRQLQRLAYTEEGKRLVSEMQQSNAAYTSAQEHALPLRNAKGGAEAVVRLMTEQLLPLHDELVRKALAFEELEQSRLDTARADSTSKASHAISLLVGLAVVALLFALGTALLLGRALSRQIGSAVQHVQSSSAELQASANQQASGAREAATAMSEVTTTMSEVLASSRQIAESAQQVAKIAEETAKAARGGDLTVSETQHSIEGIRGQVEIIVGHMLDLGKKSQQIGGILDIIDELAEQTNILSINATIEAAGAGENGKRFAVVGEEIRKLADRVSDSGKEIRGLVEEVRAAVHTTVLATEGGSKAADAGLRQFTEVTHGFKQIADLVSTTTQAAREIELSTKQQMTAVEQVNAAIRGAAQATKETEAGSAQTLETASQLAHLSHNLTLIVHAGSNA